MDKGVKLRLIIHNILYEIKKSNKTIDDLYIKYNINSLSSRDIGFINNISLNSMRYYFHSKNILKKYVKKKPNLHSELLLISAVTQIVFLNFKEYAVIDTSVEIAKKLNIFHGFINACLKKISLNKEVLKEEDISYSSLPYWFIKQTKDLNNQQKDEFINNFFKEPDLHLVFKNNNYLHNFERELVTTSDLSGFLKEKIKFEDLSSYKNGEWWVQDFSSCFALNNIDERILNKKCIDICAAPGGKAFQILSKKKDLVLNDISKKRLKILKTNLKRLNFSAKVTNIDIAKFDNKQKFDFIIIDSPCSSIGTIRKNPEIFFKQKGPNFKSLIKIQKMMLNQAADMLCSNGIILYMVCSFLKTETFDQIEDFLKNNIDFSRFEFNLKKNANNKHFIKNNMMSILPTQMNKFNIDGYFAVFLKKNK